MNSHGGKVDQGAPGNQGSWPVKLASADIGPTTQDGPYELSIADQRAIGLLEQILVELRLQTFLLKDMTGLEVTASDVK